MTLVDTEKFLELAQSLCNVPIPAKLKADLREAIEKENRCDGECIDNGWSCNPGCNVYPSPLKIGV